MKQVESLREVDLHFAGLPEDVTKAVEIVDGVPMISSLSVAELFGKDHRNLLRTIRKTLEKIDLLKNEQIKKFLTVVTSEHVDAKGRTYTNFHLNEFAFHNVVGSMTGDKAFETKLAISTQFQLTREALIESLKLAEEQAKLIADQQAELNKYKDNNAVAHVINHALVSREILDHPSYPNINREFLVFKALHTQGMEPKLTDPALLTVMFNTEHNLKASVLEVIDGQRDFNRQMYNIADLDKVEEILKNPQAHIRVIDPGFIKYRYFFEKVFETKKEYSRRPAGLKAFLEYREREAERKRLEALRPTPEQLRIKYGF